MVSKITHQTFQKIARRKVTTGTAYILTELLKTHRVDNVDCSCSKNKFWSYLLSNMIGLQEI